MDDNNMTKVYMKLIVFNLILTLSFGMAQVENSTKSVANYFAQEQAQAELKQAQAAELVREGLSEYHLTLEDIKAIDDQKNVKIIPKETLLKSNLEKDHNKKTDRIKVQIEDIDNKLGDRAKGNLYVAASDMLHDSFPVIAPQLLGAGDVFEAALNSLKVSSTCTATLEQRKGPVFTSKTITREEHSISAIEEKCQIELTETETKEKYEGLAGKSYSEADLGRDAITISIADTIGAYNRFSNVDRRTIKCLDKLNESYATSRVSTERGIVIILKKELHTTKALKDKAVEVLVISPREGDDSMRLIRTNELALDSKDASEWFE